MKKTLKPFCVLLVVISLLTAACRKGKDDLRENNNAASSAYLSEPERFPGLLNLDSLLKLENNRSIPFPASGQYDCDLKKPIYKDSVLYIESDGRNDHIVKPDYNPGAGKYYSWPAGMMIDSLTGEINVSASQGGTRYTVGYVKKGSKDTCLQNLILAGASFMDSVYVIGKNDTLAYPFYNANINAASVCDASGDNDYPDNSGHGNEKCEFDTEDNKGRKGRANQKKVKVRTISGIINLKRTLEEGAFGTPNPANGQSIQVPVYYKLAGKSSKALQKVNIMLIFYERQADIPVSLISFIGRKRAAIKMGKVVTPDGDPRPPLVVITRS